MTETTDNGTTPERTEKATFAAGCFWKPEAFYREMDGVVDTAVGYEGGHVDNPTFEMVCTWHDRSRRGRPGRVRPEDLLRAPRRQVLGDPRPDPGEPPGPGHRRSVPDRDLHPR